MRHLKGDLDIVKTAESRKKMFDWLTGDVIPLGDKDTRLIVIGTKLHNDSIIMKLKKEILENRMDGAVRAYPFLNPDGKALWHSKFPTEADIQTLRKSVPSPQAWQREYMLQIIADDDQVVGRISGFAHRVGNCRRERAGVRVAVHSVKPGRGRAPGHASFHNSMEGTSIRRFQFFVARLGYFVPAVFRHPAQTI